MNRNAKGLLVLIANAAVAGGPAIAEPRLITFDVPGATVTYVHGINNHGWITGASMNGGQDQHGFVVRPNGTFTNFDFPGAFITTPTSINDDGQITGRYQNSRETQGFLRFSDGRMVPLSGGQSFGYEDPCCINKHGEIGGAYHMLRAYSHAFLRQPDGAFTNFAVQGAQDAVIKSLNSKGVAVGYYTDTNWQRHGFVRQPDGTLETFQVPGSSTFPTSMDARGNVVGFYEFGSDAGFIRSPDGSYNTNIKYPGASQTTNVITNRSGSLAGMYFTGSWRGFIRTPDGLYTDINPTGSTWTQVEAINDKGEVVGWYQDSAGIHGFAYIPR